MELKLLNRLMILLALAANIFIFSQTKMSDIENKEILINLKKEKKNLVKIFDNSNYRIYYILDRTNFDLKTGLGTNGVAKIIFVSKKYNKSILINYEQTINHINSYVFKINLSVHSGDRHMFVPSMAILDKDFNYEYFMKYYYMPPPPPKEDGDYKSWITIQDTNNYCNIVHIDLKDNIVYENVNDILNNIYKIKKENRIKDCDCIIYSEDIKEFFPKKIIK